jgi:hypothetical protein
MKADYKDHITAASLYRFNKIGYDIQFLAGYFNSEDIVFGAGWSGALGSVSFRGEATWFQSAKYFSGRSGTGIFTIGFDKTFKNSTVAQTQIMYCNNPLKISSLGSLYLGEMSTKELAFSRISAFSQFSYPVTPLLNLSISAMWFPDMSGYFAGPSLDYSLGENVDFSILWQHFNTSASNDRVRIDLGFIRVKVNF